MGRPTEATYRQPAQRRCSHIYPHPYRKLPRGYRPRYHRPLLHEQVSIFSKNDHWHRRTSKDSTPCETNIWIL